MANNLMFEIGVKEVKEKIDDIRRKFDEFEQKYGQNGITVKLNLQGATTEAENLINALKAIGNGDALKQYEQEIKNLKQQIAQLKDTSKNASDKEAESDEKVARTKERYLKLLLDIENQQSRISRIRGSADVLGIDVSKLNAVGNTLYELHNRLYMMGRNEKGILDPKLLDSEKITTLRAEFSRLQSGYKELVGDSDKFNKAQSRNAKQLAQDTERAEVAFAKLGVRLDQYKNTIASAKLVNAPTAELENYARWLQAIQNKLEEIRQNKGLTNSGETLKQVLNGTFGANWIKGNYQEKLVRDITREMNKYQGKNYNPVADALQEYVKVAREINTLQNTAMKAEKFGVDTSDLRQKIQLLEQYRQELEQIAAGRGQRTAAEMRLDPKYSNTLSGALATNEDVKRNTAEKERNAQAT